MRPILLITSILIASCASNPDAEAHRLALWNFQYQDDIADEWKVYDRIDQPFSGDCEDFALTLQWQIGGDVWHVILPSKTPHAALIKSSTVYDNLNKHPIKKENYDGEFLFIMNKEGE